MSTARRRTWAQLADGADAGFFLGGTLDDDNSGLLGVGHFFEDVTSTY